MQAARWLATAFFILSVPTFLVLSNVRVAAMEPRVYGYSLSQYDAPARTGIDRAQLDVAAAEIARYFRSSDPLLDIRVEVNGRAEPLFSPREILHMRDVKALFRQVFRVHEIAFVYIVGYVAAVFLWSRERSMRRFAQQLSIAGIVTAGVLAAAALAVAVGFDELFTRFHLISFSNDFWLLDPRTDRLVQMFPNGFWFAVTLAVGAVTLLQGITLAAIGYAYGAWLDRRAVERTPQPAAEATPAQ